MGTAYIPITINAEDNGVFLFETECVAEIEFQTDRSDGLTGWHVSNLRFDKMNSDYCNGVWTRHKVAEAWASKSLFNVLLPYVDQRDLEERLVEKLLEDGEIALPSSAALRADYHAAVL